MADVSEHAFFVDLGDGRFRSTSHTLGPWDPQLQHGGPPSALIGRCLERTEPREDMRLARVTVEILGAVPVARAHGQHAPRPSGQARRDARGERQRGRS